MRDEWMRAAHEHLRAADLLLTEGLYHLVCFHAQRAAGRALRAMLAVNGVPAPQRETTLLDLLRACEACEPDAARLRGSCALLDLYLTSDPDATIPGMLPWGPPSYDQAAATLEAGRQVTLTLGRLKSPYAVMAVA